MSHLVTYSVPSGSSPRSRRRRGHAHAVASRRQPWHLDLHRSGLARLESNCLDVLPATVVSLAGLTAILTVTAPAAVSFKSNRAGLMLSTTNRLGEPFAAFRVDVVVVEASPGLPPSESSSVPGCPLFGPRIALAHFLGFFVLFRFGFFCDIAAGCADYLRQEVHRSRFRQGRARTRPDGSSGSQLLRLLRSRRSALILCHPVW